MLYIYTYCMLILYFLTCRGTKDDTWIQIPSARSSYNVRMKTLGFYFYGCWNCLCEFLALYNSQWLRYEGIQGTAQSTMTIK